MKRRRIVIGALAFGITTFLVGTWLDSVILADAERVASATFTSSSFVVPWTLGALTVAASVMLLGALGYLARSLVVGAVYMLIGAAYTLAPIVRINVPTIWSALVDYGLKPFFAPPGPLNAVVILGAAMLIGGAISTLRAMTWRTEPQRLGVTESSLDDPPAP